jgi:hypothetical protein
MERYHISLLEKLAKADEWALWSALENLEIPERLKQLERHFLEHALHYDDAGSSKLLEYIMLTITDEQLLPFAAGVVRPEGEFLVLEESKWKEIEVASYTAKIKRAFKAMELFPELPVSKPVRGVEYVAEEQTLTKTKEALLSEVANGWRTAREESDADVFFDLIPKAKMHRDDEQIRAGVLRKITDEGFPAYRLAHTIARFQNELKNYKKGILEILAHGWVKHTQANDVASALYAIEPLSKPAVIPGMYTSGTSSAEAFDFVRRVAERIKLIDDKVRRMLTKVGSVGGYAVEYPEQNLSVPNVTVTHDGEIRDENFGHKIFEYERDNFRKWLEENHEDPRLRVKLHHIGRNRRKEILVDRDEILY